MKPVVMYTTAICPFCRMAKRLFDSKGVKYTEIRIDRDPSKRQEMISKAGRTSVPQIWVGDVHTGGFDDTYALEQKGKLDSLLKES